MIKELTIEERLQVAANVIRGLSIDGVQIANSGHPGLPLGAADMATVLWVNFLNHNPANPNWFNRDRFVLSGGHGSMLLYSLLHLSGYDLSIDDLKKFRQLHSKTPGHPEYGHTPGVETTTGPLGQGLANAVGFALAESSLAARYNTPSHLIIDHFTYAFVGDGDLQEGISHEAASLAGHLKLGKLIVLYDDNQITIDGSTSLSFSENIPQRFQSYGWHVLEIDGHNIQAIHEAIDRSKSIKDQPSLIVCKTIIGKGSPNKAGSHDVHGAPLGAEEKSLTKKVLGLKDEDFYVNEEDAFPFRNSLTEGRKKEEKWNDLVADYKSKYPKLYDQFSKLQIVDTNTLKVDSFSPEKSIATRSASGEVINQIWPQLPGLVGGSADLTPSNNTFPIGGKSYSVENPEGRYIHYGVREHAMGAVMNGMALHGGIIPYSGTFFVFSDYMRPAMRMSALMQQQVIYVLTHDSIGLGEDGPTHQPVSHLTSLRAIPGMHVIRPADANETIIAWKLALEYKGPSALVLTRQKLPVIDDKKVQGAKKGGYVLDEDKDFDCIIIATGSEVHLAIEAKKKLNEKGKKVRVVSMPCIDIFDEQSDTYKYEVLPPEVECRVAVEAGATSWGYKYVGLKGKVIGLDTFGASAPFEALYEYFGITSEAIKNSILTIKN